MSKIFLVCRFDKEHDWGTEVLGVCTTIEAAVPMAKAENDAIVEVEMDHFYPPGEQLPPGTRVWYPNLPADYCPVHGHAGCANRPIE
ncbi:MAG TPA: hypothetical protein VGM05_33175 [Planctomycetaceae bacterium]|jgi:hypothetical protein